MTMFPVSRISELYLTPVAIGFLPSVVSPIARVEVTVLFYQRIVRNFPSSFERGGRQSTQFSYNGLRILISHIASRASTTFCPLCSPPVPPTSLDLYFRLGCPVERCGSPSTVFPFVRGAPVAFDGPPSFSELPTDFWRFLPPRFG